MRSNPYLGLPTRSRWDRAVARNFSVNEVYSGPVLVKANEAIVSAGSCFAANIVPYLERAGLKYLRTEAFPSVLSESFREVFAYDGLSARYGNIYTTRQLLQLLLRATGQFLPAEDRWHEKDKVIDPFRPGLKYAASSDYEFDILTEAHLEAVREAFANTNVFIFTLGLTEAWESSIDGAVFPACPGTIAGTFDPERHRFHNFELTEVVEDLRQFITSLRQINPGVRVILTVSPVPLVATVEQRHVLESTIYSKSVLRVAAEMTCRHFTDCVYFPSYEIVSGPQAPSSAYESDRRNPSREIIDTVMSCFFAHCVDSDGSPLKISEFSEVGSSSVGTEPGIREIARNLANAECEEEAVLKD